MEFPVNKVLLVIDWFASGIPEHGLSPIPSLLSDTLKASKLVKSLETFYFDVTSREIGLEMMGEKLLSLCASTRPDLVIFYPLGWQELDPPRSIMYVITNTLDIKVYMMRGDSIGPAGDAFNKSWFPFVSYIGFWDVTVDHLGYSENPKAIQGFTPPNTNYYYDRRLERDIDVSFVGAIGDDKPHRAEYIAFLQNNGINILTTGGYGDKATPPNEYSAIISRSRIGLNFGLHYEGYSQLKGRAIDTMACKTLLIEDEGIETSAFFEEGRDFIMVRSKEEMLEKVRYYLDHDEERQRIAESGYKKTREFYNAGNVWGYQFSKMGFKIPGRLARDRHYQELYQKLDSLKR